MVWWVLGRFPHNLVLWILSDRLDGIPLVSRFTCPYCRYCIAAFLGDTYWYLGILLQGAPKFLEGLLCNCEAMSLGVFSVTPFLVVP